MRAEAIQREVSIRTDRAAYLPQMTGDRVEVQQVLMNLILNGIEAMRRWAALQKESATKSGFCCWSSEDQKIQSFSFASSRKTSMRFCTESPASSANWTLTPD